MIGRTWLFEPWRTRVLWSSVALNLFGGALIGGYFYVRHPPGPPGFEGVVNRMARDLSNEDGLKFRAVLATEQPWYGQSRRALDEAREALSRSIAHAPFDEAEVRLRMQALQARWMESSTRFGDGVLAGLAQISPEGRVRLAETALQPRR